MTYWQEFDCTSRIIFLDPLLWQSPGVLGVTGNNIGDIGEGPGVATLVAQEIGDSLSRVAGLAVITSHI